MKRKKEIIGQLRDQLTIQAETATIDDYGAEKLTWTKEATVYCSVKQSRTGNAESFVGDQQIVFQLLEFTIRHRASLTEKKQVLYSGKTYDIITIMPDPRKVFTTIVCQMRQ